MGIIILLIALCVPAFIIQMSVSAITGTDEGFGKAFGAWFMTNLAAFAAGYVIGLTGISPEIGGWLAIIAGVITFAMTIQVSYDMTFKDALKVWAVNLAIWIIIIIALLIFGFGLAFLTP